MSLTQLVGILHYMQELGFEPEPPTSSRLKIGFSHTNFLSRIIQVFLVHANPVN